MSDKNPTYYTILPAVIRYHDDLTSGQKILFSEISTLSYKHGYCYASNGYFAKVLNVSPSTASKWISGLKEAGLIEVRYEYDGKQITERKIYISKDIRDVQERIELIQEGIESNQYLKKTNRTQDGLNAEKGIESIQGGIESDQEGVLNLEQGGIESRTKYNSTRENTIKNKDSIDSDSDESPSCLPDKDAFDYLLADLEVDDYPKHNVQGKILRFTIWFYQRVAEQFGHHKKVQQANLFKWKEHIRLMVEQDGISLSRQLDVARWVFNDSFWRTVIRSTSNFRDEWEDIDAAIMREADTQEDQKKNRRKFTRYEGEMLMLDNGLLHNKRKGGGYEFEDVFEHLEGEGKQAVYVIKKSCLNLFKTWSR